MYKNILLEEEQKQLIEFLVEGYRNIKRDERRVFISFDTSEGRTTIDHPGLLNGGIEAYKGDIETLSREGLIAIKYGEHSILEFDITPQGFKCYEEIKKKQNQPIQRVEITVKKYIDADRFQKKYPKSYQKWIAAESLLWSSDSAKQLTAIGHHCREALQEFATSLVVLHKPPDVDVVLSHTVARIRSVINLKRDKIGVTERKFLDALLTYWGTINDLIQRQEHGAQNEGLELIWEDGRRIVFQVAILIMEIDRSLSLIK